MKTIRHAWFRLRRQPAFAAAAIVTLALGLGANTAMFSFADGLLVHPLGLPDLNRLVTVWLAPEKQAQGREAVSSAEFLLWREQARSLVALAALQDWTAEQTTDPNPEQFTGARVSGNFFSTLGIRAIAGQLFGEEAARPGQDDVVVISEGLWRRRHAANPAALGATLRLNGRPYRVAGVVPAAQAYPVGADLWAPLPLEPGARLDWQRRDLELIGRLQPQTSLSSVESELRTLADRERTRLETPETRRQARVVSLRDHLLANSEVPAYLFIVVLAATFLLALACANVANLQLAQMHGRQREFAIRAALGGTPQRLTGQVLVESLALCFLGGLAGLLVAAWTIQLIRASLPADLLPFVPGWSAVGLDLRAFGFAALATALTGFFAGLVPALTLSHQHLDVVLRQGVRGSTGGGRHALRRVLVVAELALAFVLVVACGMVVKRFAGLIFARHGFESDRLLSLRISLPAARYPDVPRITRFFEDARAEIAALPGVEIAALTSTLPFYSRDEDVFSRTATPSDPAPRGFNVQAVTPEYFRALRIGLQSGRAFEIADRATAASVAIVSERVAALLWPGESPLGRTLWQRPGASDARSLTVIGVAAEVRQDWRGDSGGTVYVPFGQSPQRTMFLSLRTTGDPVRHAQAVRARIQNLDAAQPLPQPKAMKQVIVESMAGLCITAGVLSFMGVVSLLVATAGLYSVVSNSVSQRTRELGIRMALGARPGEILRQILQEGLRLALVGIGVGFPLALAASRLFRSSVAGIPALESEWFLLLALLLLGITLLACYLPARRASRVDPSITLRSE